MKIAIVSDIHDNLPNLEKFSVFAKKEKIGALIVCGDTTNEETLEFINKNFMGEIFLITSNMDTIKKELSSFKEFTIDNFKIAISHFPEEAKKLARSQKYDFVFYGHTHKPWLEQIGNCLLANPGNLSGILYKATFAILDAKTKKLTLKILEKL